MYVVKSVTQPLALSIFDQPQLYFVSFFCKTKTHEAFLVVFKHHGQYVACVCNGADCRFHLEDVCGRRTAAVKSSIQELVQCRKVAKKFASF